MKSVRFRGGYRRGDSDRHSFAFFVVGALVVIAVAFFIGLQVGRVVEKSAAKEQVAAASPGQAGTDSDGAGKTAADIRREMSAYSEEAVRIPVVTPPAVMPPSAGEELRRTEEDATFPETLTRKDPSPEPLAGPKGKKDGKVATPPNGKFLLQAGALKSRDAAEGLRGRLEHAGYKAKIYHAVTKGSGEVYRVRVGPFSTREEAKKAMKAIKAGMKIDVILVQG